MQHPRHTSITSASRVLVAGTIGLACAVLVPSPVSARANPAASPGQPSGYRLPPENIRRVLDTPPTPTVSLSPDHQTLLFLERPNLPPIADLAAPMLRLAGSRLNPRTNSPHGPRRYTGFSIRPAFAPPDAAPRKLDLPADANLSAPGWSADGRFFVFTNIVANGTELWVGDASGSVRRLAGPIINAATGASARWMPDQKSLLVKFIPEGRGPMPLAPTVPTGPVVQDADGTPSPVRTYQDLLQNSSDEAVFDWIATSQLAIVDVATGARRDIGEPAIFGDATPSPSGEYLLVSRLQKPYSYQVPWGLFPESIEIWHLRDTENKKAGALAKHLFDIPLRENIPTMGVETGPRAIEWSDTRPATLIWAEALDEGDPRKKVPHRDRVMMLAAQDPRFGPTPQPFSRTPEELARLQHRYSGLVWLQRSGAPELQPTDRADRVLITEYERERRWTRTWLMRVNNVGVPAIDEPSGTAPDAGASGVPGVAADGSGGSAGSPVAGPAGARLVFDRSINDRYGNPGSPLMDRTAQGFPIVKVDPGTDSIYLRGPGASPEGDRPFFDRMKLADFSKERLWQNTGECYEAVVDIAEDDASHAGAGPRSGIRSGGGLRVITSYETRTTPPNLYVVDLSGRDPKPGDEIKKQAALPPPPRAPLTSFPDPLPELRKIKKEIITYTRDDGVPLSATMYLPPDYKDGTKLPLVIWAYPNEVSDASTAGQVSGSEYRYTQIGGTSHLFLLLAGYAVMDDASMPVIGDAETMNDTFVKQIVANAQAAIDKAASMGVADRDRVAVGGHSYGAFMTANLLAHCPQGMFRAGIARSGAYNRTLTPFGFQSERRSFWEAPDVYIKLSPFTYADKIKTPLLMTHGEIDANSGTFPMQSERLFQAIKGNGGTARLVLLPYESHGYMGRESVMHVLAEMIEWLEKYVRE